MAYAIGSGGVARAITGRMGNGNGVGKKPTTSVTKSVSYIASGANSNQILAIAGTDSDTITTADAPTAISIRNDGSFSAVVMC